MIDKRNFEEYVKAIENYTQNFELGKDIIKPGNRVLDVGCEKGIALLGMYEKAKPKGVVDGVEIDKKTAKAAATIIHRLIDQKEWTTTEKGKAENNIRVHNANAENLEMFKNNLFDVIFSFKSIMWMNDKIKAINEMSRVLKNGGTAYIVGGTNIYLIQTKSPVTNKNKKEIWDKLNNIKFELNATSYDRMEFIIEHFKDYGFDIIDFNLFEYLNNKKIKGVNLELYPRKAEYYDLLVIKKTAKEIKINAPPFWKPIKWEDIAGVENRDSFHLDIKDQKGDYLKFD